jgi:hypothetical protein
MNVNEMERSGGMEAGTNGPCRGGGFDQRFLKPPGKAPTAVTSWAWASPGQAHPALLSTEESSQRGRREKGIEPLQVPAQADQWPGCCPRLTTAIPWGQAVRMIDVDPFL